MNIINGSKKPIQQQPFSDAHYDDQDDKECIETEVIRPPPQRESREVKMRNKQQPQPNISVKVRSKSVTFLDEMNNSLNQNQEDEINYEQQKTYQSNDNDYNQHQFAYDFSNQENFENNLIDENEHSYGYEHEDLDAMNGVNSRLLKNSDARGMCDTFTGVGPIRGIMKKSANDLTMMVSNGARSSCTDEYIINYDEESLPRIRMENNVCKSGTSTTALPVYVARTSQQAPMVSQMVKSQTTPNLKRRDMNSSGYSLQPQHVMQSDL